MTNPFVASPKRPAPAAKAVLNYLIVCAALVALFHYLNDNPDVCRALYGKSWESEFTRSAKEMIAKRCLGQLTPDGGTPRQQYLLAFAINGCFGTIAAWQTAGYQTSPDEMAVITWQAIRAVKELL